MGNDTLTIPDTWRLALYIAMAIFPVWLDFLAKSSDYSLRGLAMPIVSSLNAAVIVALAKTSTKQKAPDAAPQDVKVVNEKADPIPTHETKPTPEVS